MRIILQETVEPLGHRGQVLDVADGYARNYLLPRKLALPATAGNLKRLEHLRATFVEREATELEGARKLAELLATATVTLARKAGENDQLFGSVTSGDIAEALERQGFAVDKRKIELEEPIKLLGEYPVSIKLQRDVSATVKVIINREV